MSNLSKDISYLFELETNCYALNRTMNKISSKWNSLGKSKNYSKPNFENYDKEAKIKSSDFEFETGCVMCAIIGAIIGIIYGFNHMHGFEKILGAIVAGVIGALIGGVSGFIISLVVHYIKKSTIETDFKMQFDKDMQTYSQKIAADEKRVAKENKEKQILSKEYSLLKNQYDNTKKLLKEAYEKVGIDEGYRNIIPIGYMNEFCRLGVSNTLDGTDGLYYLVRKELRYDSFNYQLNEISSKLDRIIDQNSELYSELSSINKKCDTIVSNSIKAAEIASNNSSLIETAVKNSEVAAYNSQMTLRQAEIANDLSIYYHIR